MKQLTERQQEILQILKVEEQISISKIKDLLSQKISQITLNRDLSLLVKNNFLKREGKGRAIRYIISDYYKVFELIDTTTYFDKEPDERINSSTFNFTIFKLLTKVEVFNELEKSKLVQLKSQYQKNINNISPKIHQKELERFTIEMSWKSAKIEGNTYSLLETEQLFKEKIEAKNKTREEAIMLLNHKDALNYMLEYKSLAKTINIRFIDEIHTILTKDLGITNNIRSRIVGITGTAYRPIDNEFQIKEALQKLCDLINSKKNGFEKAMLIIVLISYIQPFEDGNKRTARMLGNAILIANNSCPLSYRSVTVLDYKKAILLFYEQNNLTLFKNLFIEQNTFAVENYF